MTLYPLIYSNKYVLYMLNRILELCKDHHRDLQDADHCLMFTGTNLDHRTGYTEWSSLSAVNLTLRQGHTIVAYLEYQKKTWT